MGPLRTVGVGKHPSVLIARGLWISPAARPRILHPLLWLLTTVHASIPCRHVPIPAPAHLPFLRPLALLLVPAFLCIVFASAAQAATWIVQPDPDNPVDRVGQVVLQAASGDTVLIEAGIYYEHIPLESKSLVIRGISGAGSTILDGSVEIEGREGSVLYGSASENGGDLVLEGLTFQKGDGVPKYLGKKGGGICLQDNGEARVVVRDCDFLDNALDPSQFCEGAGAWIDGRDVTISGCRFEGCYGADQGGGIYLSAYSGNPRIQSCEFRLGDPDAWFTQGEAIFVRAFEKVTIEDCQIFGGGLTDPSAICVEGGAALLNNRILSEGGSGSRGVEIHAGSFWGSPYEVEVRGNLFACGQSSYGGWFYLGSSNTDIEVVGNTFVYQKVRIGSGGGSCVVRENVFYGEEVKFSTGWAVASCNCIWPESALEIGEHWILEDNVFADPLFCDPDAGDYHIARQSPAAPGNGPDGCGRMGAFDPACDLVPVEESTWGSIKARFR